MGVSDVVAANLATVYLVVIAAMKAHGLVTGQGFSGGFVVVVSTTVVCVMLILSIIWDVSQKAAKVAVTRGHDDGGELNCRGGICWHGVAVRSPAAQVRFRLPQHQPHNLPYP